MKTRYLNDKDKVIERTLTDQGFIFERQVEQPDSWRLNDARNEIHMLDNLLHGDKHYKLLKPRVS